jgi:hypothetical protein
MAREHDRRILAMLDKAPPTGVRCHITIESTSG